MKTMYKHFDKFFVFFSTGVVYFVSILSSLRYLIRSAIPIYTVDFRGIYTGVVMVLSNTRSDMYALSAQFHAQRVVFPLLHTHTWLMPVLTPPFVSFFLAPLALFSVKTSYLIWGVCNLFVLFAICCLTIVSLQSLSFQKRYVVFLLILLFSPVWEAIMQGQLSLVLTLVLCLGWFLINKQKNFFAGLILSALLIKPYLVLLPFLFLFVTKRTAFYGFVTGIIILCLLSFGIVGISGIQHYLGLLYAATNWGDAYTIHPQAENTWGGLLSASLHTNLFSQIFLPWLLGVSFSVVLLLWSLRRTLAFDLQWALFIFTTIFISPHFLFHDLTILLAAFLPIAHYMLSHSISKKLTILLSALLLLGYFSPLIEAWYLEQNHFFHLVVWALLLCMGVLIYCLNTTYAIKKSTQ